jgi:3-phenylpropionate/trans-cinnamate dioxygenase ferredoxin reductase component
MEHAEHVIIGGGLAGGYAAQAIRQRDRESRVILVTDEKNLPYDRVPLSKGYLVGRVKRESVFLKKQDFYDQNSIELILGHKATNLDLKAKSVALDDGREFTYNQLLLATGGRPRKLPIPGSDLQGIHYLRTIEDSNDLQALMSGNRKAVIIGGGFIGCELAAAFIGNGLDTTIVEMGPYLLNMALDPETGRWITDYFVKRGMKMILNAAAEKFVGANGQVVAVETKDGLRTPADFVCVGIGIAPNTELAEKAGLKVEKGIVVDEHLQASQEGIYAAGDVARFYSPLYERHLRVEHYDVAVKHGRIAGANMTGDNQAFNEPPHFFSFMFNLVCNVYGDLSQHDGIIRRGELNLDKGFLQFYMQEGRINAVLSMNRSIEELRTARSLLISRRSIEDPSALSDESKPLQSLS